MALGLSDLSILREGNRLELKEAAVGLPKSVWETYSAFANTEGGVIILGVKERRGTAEVTGVSNPDQLVKNFWDAVNNPSKVSSNILANSDVAIEPCEGTTVVVIRVPRAQHDAKPVYLNGNPLTGTYRRNGEGDYHCSQREVSAMLRDNADNVQDRHAVDGLTLDALCPETVRRYRNALGVVRPEHPWLNLENDEFLLRIGAAARNGQLRPTRAGLLMFGYEHEIVREFPLYFMEYQEVMSDARWDDRLVTNDGEWTGNVFDFWRLVLPRIFAPLKRPFNVENGIRIDDTPLHKAFREGLANALVHADYYGEANTVVTLTPDSLTLRNPGTVRIDPEVAQLGGISSQRNPALMTMFNLIGIGERAGAGFDTMRRGCQWANVPDPLFGERFAPDRVELSFTLEDIAVAGPAIAQQRQLLRETEAVIPPIVPVQPLKPTPEAQILRFLEEHEEGSRRELEGVLELSRSSTNNALKRLVDQGAITVIGGGRSTRYRLVN